MNRNASLDGSKERGFHLVCVSEDHSAVAGGAPAVVDQLTQRVAASGYPVNLVFVRENPMPIKAGVTATRIEPHRLGNKWGWSPQLDSGFRHLLQDAGNTVLHLHGIWAAPQFVSARLAHKLRRPFIVSAHGMLEPWLWERQGWRVKLKKRVYWKVAASRALLPATVVHAITPMERDHLRALFPTNRIEVIPNAIDLDQYPGGPSTASERERLILFVGRIEPKKGIDLLLHAFAAARLDRDWRVAIIGPVWSQAYQAELKQIVISKGLQERVTFLGPVFGAQKAEWIRKAWVMAVPSHSEVVGLVNLEAAACHTPTITTHETGLFDWASGGGLLIHPDVGQLKVALEQSCAWSALEQQQRGAASRQLVAERYSWRVVLPQWISLYQSLAAGG